MPGKPRAFPCSNARRLFAIVAAMLEQRDRDAPSTLSKGPKLEACRRSFFGRESESPRRRHCARSRSILRKSV